MDPMTFLPDEEESIDDDKLRPSDVSLLIDYFQKATVFGKKWVISIFCFELRRGPNTNYYELFLKEMQRMSESLGLHMDSLEVSYGNPHAAAIFSSSEDVIDQIRQEWQTLHNV